MAGPGAEGGDAVSSDSSGRAEQEQMGQQSLQPHGNAPLGSALRQRFLAPTSLVCGLPVKCANRNCCFSSQFLPTRSSGQEWGSTHTTQRTPPAHSWVTPSTTCHTAGSNFKNLFISNCREIGALQVQAHKAGQFWTISEQCQLSF